MTMLRATRLILRQSISMDDTFERCAIFCTAEVLHSTIESFLAAVEKQELETHEAFRKLLPVDTSIWFSLITTKDLSSIRCGLSLPVQPFTSPFIDHSLEEVTAWFTSNITQPQLPGYHPYIFLVFDKDSAREEVCTIVSTLDQPVGQLRCEFKVTYDIFRCVDHQGGTEEGFGEYSRTGEVLTKENFTTA
ncbi:hypothetical protein D9619_006023 [Psilocybe cf. subviscida]|uniref:Uncharacterized protein n=1 Tax=Psilocybe cf. subviscida TaxID=2480587 RepID=A0A8H5BWQ9_9AGAR|nr:hypothetical protein D9619_006023 [Psilocybe cf. subviscida]